MVIVADTSPVVALIKIGHIDILPRMFGTVTIPTMVADELSSPKRPDAVRTFVIHPPGWLSV